MADDDNNLDTSVVEPRIIHEVVPGESTPISSAATPAVSAICNQSAEVQLEQKAAGTAGTPRRIVLARSHHQLSELGALNREKEQHKVRLQGLRKEVNYLKATEWLYDPIEKLIGRGNP